jgi:hypothetical protein
MAKPGLNADGGFEEWLADIFAKEGIDVPHSALGMVKERIKYFDNRPNRQRSEAPV